MATCEPYLDCDNANESWISLFLRLIVEQPDGTLAVRTCCEEEEPEPEEPLNQ
jgi:hypothetical protein